MGVAPEKLIGVVAYGQVIDGPNILGHCVGVQPGVAAHLVDAIGALATKPKEAMGIRASMAVIPEDDNGVAVKGYFQRNCY